MKNDKTLREHLVKLLTGGEAHADFETAIKDVPVNVRGMRPKGTAHSLWELLEHMRIAQWDILEYARNTKHVSPEFPKGYWPESAEPPNEKAWDKSVKAFRAGLKEIADVVADESTDLFAKISHGDGQTML